MNRSNQRLPKVLPLNMQDDMPDVLYTLAERAKRTGESLDDLFRLHRPDLFREFKGQLGPVAKDEPIKRHFVLDAKKSSNGIG